MYTVRLHSDTTTSNTVLVAYYILSGRSSSSSVASMSAEGVSPAHAHGQQQLHGSGSHGHDSPHIGNIEKCKYLSGDPCPSCIEPSMLEPTYLGVATMSYLLVFGVKIHPLTLHVPHGYCTIQTHNNYIFT